MRIILFFLSILLIFTSSIFCAEITDIIENPKAILNDTYHNALRIYGDNNKIIEFEIKRDMRAILILENIIIYSRKDDLKILIDSLDEWYTILQMVILDYYNRAGNDIDSAEESTTGSIKRRTKWIYFKWVF